jgi:hypothetical protein
LETIIFVYNADSGIFNLLTDAAHKMLSPETYSCNLCSITYSAVGIKKEWKDYIAKLPLPVEFLHRDELQNKYGIQDVILPAVFIKKNTDVSLLIGSDLINSCKTVADLARVVNTAVTKLLQVNS